MLKSRSPSFIASFSLQDHPQSTFSFGRLRLMKEVVPVLSMSLAIEMQSSGPVFGSHWHLRNNHRILEVD
jgi:hypothetical protein